MPINLWSTGKRERQNMTFACVLFFPGSFSPPQFHRADRKYTHPISLPVRTFLM